MKHVIWKAAGAVAAIWAAGQLVKELHPLTGEWLPARALVDGQEVELNPSWRLCLEISDRGHVFVGTYWTCGVRNETFAAGKMEVKGSRILLFRENWATGERDPYPRGVLHRLAKGRIGVSFATAEGNYWVEFQRVSNASTIFDAVGWR